LVNNGHQIIGIITSRSNLESTINEDDIKNYADLINAKFVYDPKITADKLMSEFDFEQIDIGLSVNYTGIISGDVLNLFKHGVLNAHGGDLPRYRGNACQAWAIINGETNIGICVHKMIGNELDSGKIISRKYVDITIDTRIGQVYKVFDDEIPKLFLEAVEKLNQNYSFFIEKQSTNPNDILRCYPRTPIDGKICWDKPNDEILRLINASSEPYFGAFCNFKEEKMIIWRAKLFNDNERWIGIPGQIASILRTGEIIVLTGKGKLAIEEIEYKGVRCKPNTLIKSLRERLN
jgi:methionyl-tRNA formyltransferase